MFALELYRKLGAKPGNLFCSPYSVGAALALLAGGAGGDTLGEIAGALGTADPVEAAAALVGELASRDNARAGVALSIANALWHQLGYPIAAAYVETMTTRLAAAVKGVDFAGQPAQAIEAINTWAARSTRGKITNILQQLPADTRVILANAIYMKARWEDQFSEHATRPLPFNTPRGKANVPTMIRTGHYAYAKLSATEVIELPYAGGKLAMLVIVPQLGGLASFEKVVDVDRVASALTRRSVELAIPKWKIESTFQLRDTLRGLGIVKAFRGGDFTPMSSERGFVVDEVIHKTYVDVDEKGTEAAAVTAMMTRGGAPRFDDVVKLHVDRPFLFAIRDVPTKTILFMGRLEDPR